MNTWIFMNNMNIWIYQYDFVNIRIVWIFEYDNINMWNTNRRLPWEPDSVFGPDLIFVVLLLVFILLEAFVFWTLLLFFPFFALFCFSSASSAFRFSLNVDIRSVRRCLSASISWVGRLFNKVVCGCSSISILLWFWLSWLLASWSSTFVCWDGGLNLAFFAFFEASLIICFGAQAFMFLWYLFCFQFSSGSVGK